tara:strand:+ start:230 stop:496 length:267 start_codon:yes stop_codon:yes gene_type:complete
MRAGIAARTLDAMLLTSGLRWLWWEYGGIRRIAFFLILVVFVVAVVRRLWNAIGHKVFGFGRRPRLEFRLNGDNESRISTTTGSEPGS